MQNGMLLVEVTTEKQEGKVIRPNTVETLLTQGVVLSGLRHVGNTVVFKTSMALPWEYNGKPYKIVHESHIYAVLPKVNPTSARIV